MSLAPLVATAGTVLAAGSGLLPQAAALVPGDASTEAIGPAARATATNACVVSHDKRAGPSTVALGDTVEITLTTRVRCTPPVFRIHVVIAIDESAAMAGRPIRQALESARGIVDALDLANRSHTAVGVVAFDDGAQRLAGLTNDPDRVGQALSRVQAGTGSPRIETGLTEALRVLVAGARNLDRDSVTDLIVLYSLGPEGSDCAPALRASRQVRGSGVLLIAVCADRGCDKACLRDLASSPRYFFDVSDPALLSVVYQIRDRIYNIGARSLTVTDTLSAGVELVAGSARPSPAATDANGRWIQWHDVYVPWDGIAYTLRVRPLRLGESATNDRAEGEMIANNGERHEWRFRVPTVVVARPSPSATPTAMPTATPRFEAMTPPAVPTRVGAPRLYIPAAMRPGAAGPSPWPSSPVGINLGAECAFGNGDDG